MDDKYYKVKVMELQEQFVLRVPIGVEINEEILENSWYLDEYKNKEDISISFSEVDKELCVEYDLPLLEKDGDITFDYDRKLQR